MRLLVSSTPSQDKVSNVTALVIDHLGVVAHDSSREIGMRSYECLA